MEIINDLLAYDGLKIIQRPDMFNFSLDSLMLGYFSEVNYKTEKVMDLCTGNAPVAMYLTLRTKAKIFACEIQDDVYDLAKKSLALNDLEERIHLYHRDLKDIHKVVGVNSFDLVTCNPPYFKLMKTSNLNATDYKTLARHEVTATLEDIIIESKRLLKNKGYLCMVHRPERLAEIFEVLEKHNLAPKNIRFVHPKLGENANSVIIHAQKDAKPGLKVFEPVVVHEGKEYSKKVKEVFHYPHNVL